MDIFRKWSRKDDYKISYFLVTVFVLMVIIIAIILTNWYKSYEYMKTNNQQLVVNVLQQNRKIIKMRQIVYELTHETEIDLVSDYDRSYEELKVSESELNRLTLALLDLQLTTEETNLVRTLSGLSDTYYTQVFANLEPDFIMTSQEQRALLALGRQMINTINQMLEINYMHVEEISISSLKHSKNTTFLFYQTVLLFVITIIFIIKFILKPSYTMEQTIIKEANLDYLTRLCTSQRKMEKTNM